MLEKINQRLNELLPKKDSPLQEAARYALLAPGKRLRPLLTLATVQDLGGNLEHALDSACAIEMIHCYSMIHDDLPCMDDDDFRRGRPTLHKVYNEGHAVLTGDFLLTHAFETLSRAKHLTPEQKCRSIQILSKASGGSGMIEGQVLDLTLLSGPVTQETLELVHRKKTGALIEASVSLGSLSANADESELATFGATLGLAFQILDDIKDVTHSEEKHGKKESSDAINGKTTFVSLLGLDKATALAQEKLTLCLDSLPPGASLLKEVVRPLLLSKIS